MEKNTKLLHHLPADSLTGSIAVPIYQTSTYVQEAPGVNKGFDYSRTSNPTRFALEEILAQLEGGHRALAFSSGLAAIDAVIKLLRSGDEVLAVDDIYGGTFRAFNRIFDRFGIKVKPVDTTDPENVRAALSPATRMIWLESPTNPTLKISDIVAIAAIAQEAGVLLVVDNTFCSPYLQNPLELGADIVIHSATKYLAGHCDVIAGAVVAKDPALCDELKFIQNSSGAILGPWDSWLVIRGIETLGLRLDAHCNNAQKVAEFLEEHPAVDRVFYPGLPGHKNHDVACRQQRGFGGVVTFCLKQDSVAAANKVVSSTRIFKLAESLGGVKSLLCHPAQMTHASVPREARLKSGIRDGLIRLSVGIEAAVDLCQDLDRALQNVLSKESGSHYGEEQPGLVRGLIKETNPVHYA